MLIGRDAERAMIGALLEAARASRSGALVVRGEPGMGKTALLEDAREQGTDMKVLSARGVESESDLAFAGLHQLIRPALYLLEALPRPQAGALRGALGLSDRSGVDRFLVSAACLTLLSELAEQRPVLCLVDDVQWLDTPSSDALLFVSRRLDAEGIVILFGAREGDAGRFDPRGLRNLKLVELDPESSMSLLVQRAEAALAPSVRDKLVEQAAGNALALVELPSALSESQLAGDEPLPDALPLTESLANLYLARVRQLPEPAQRLLLVAAADETNHIAPMMSAAKLLGISSDTLDLAEADELVRVQGARVEFHHPLVRSSIYQGASPGERRIVHKALAEASSEAHDADRRAWHLAAAATGPDADIADVLEATADRARARSGYSAAAAALERASDLSVDQTSSARRLVSAAAGAWHAGQPDRARSLLERARPIVSDPLVRADLDHLDGVIQFWCGGLLDAYEILIAAVENDASLDHRKALEMLFDAAEAAGWAGDFARMAEIGHRAAALPQSDDEEDTFLADLLVGVGGLFEGKSASELPVVLDVVARADTFDEPRWLVWTASAAGVAGDEAREMALLRRAVGLARASGAVDALTHVLVTLALRGLLGGRQRVSVEAAEGLRLAREAGLPNAASLHLAVLSWFAALNGNEHECRTYAAEVNDAARATGHGFANSIAQWGVGLLDLSRGEPDRARTRLAALSTAPPGVGQAFIALMCTPDLVEACVRTRRHQEARAAYAVLDGFARPGAPTWALGLAARCRALLASDQAEAEFADALQLHLESDRPFDRARTELLLGEYLRRTRRRLESREHLRAAFDAFEAQGATLWAERARTELRASGETARKRDPSTIDLLTPQELQIARLVAQGLSNKEVAAQLFLSPRTIHHHLRRVFVKLEITSRTQLARLPLGDGEPASAISLSATAQS